ncbi:pantetheine-phosphate adenylyltransferase [Butyrivibrio sp. INlla16]|uniref:pantetheine-phosphate adenylyltransferase n=1 Tax=Butyrivibrio sp. INlla16 TaxID=1520807 RepID=UPI00087E85BF|nr:pantetheine-phosphate adenylyltransferase [Butyrivibrio sp. INlla16]SDB16517.1 Phosphopantetheine adenylyltransferase [Butyrivibrio sp. INlla16]
MKIAVYPGSFDPITLGHLDIIKRASAMFDKLVVVVSVNTAKSPLFSVDERVKMIKEAVKDLDNVEIDCHEGLIIDYCKQNNIRILLRGLRAITDFEYELQIAQTNKAFSQNEVDTVFLTTSLEYAYLSSSTVREFASFHGDISRCVTEYVAQMVYEKYGYDKQQIGG